MRVRLSDLQRMAVETEHGERLGHLFDIAASHEADDRPPVLARLLVGRTGLARRMGIGRRSLNEIPVDAIVKVEPGRLVVRAERPGRDDGAGRPGS